MGIKDTAKLEVFFDDPRLRMTVGGRLLVRVVTWITYLVLIVATLSFLGSSIVRLRFIGAFLALMLIDFLIHRGEGSIPISELSPSGKINAAESTRPIAFSVLERAFDGNTFKKQNFFLETAERLLEFPQIQEGLVRLDIPAKEFRAKLDDLLEKEIPSAVTKAEMLNDAGRLGLAAFRAAIEGRHEFIEITDLFSALPNVGDEATARLFKIFSIDPGDLDRALIVSSGSRAHGLGRLPAMLGGFTFDSHRRISHRIMNRAWTSRPTPNLDRYGVDFTDLAREGQIGFLVGHADEYEQLAESLGRPINPNALLVGESGIGREAIVQHLAFRLSKDDVPKALFDKRLVSLEIQNLIAGASPDELNERLKKIVQDINIAGNVILYIPDIHNLVKTSGAAYLSAADALMPVIMNNQFPVVGATYPKEFKQIIEPRSDFVGAFEVIRVKEITEAEAEKILAYEALLLEKHSNITVSFGAIKRAVFLAKKYFKTKFLPSSAEELLKTAFVEAEHREEKTLGPDLVTAVAERKSNIPMHEASGEEVEKLLHMEDAIHERLVGQDEAVKAVSQALREYRSGLARPGGPIASFLFVGPTGVGKTELAKILAKIQFGSEAAMMRFDMTEYQDKPSFARFIGSADGSTHGALTDAVLEKPYGLILLDEFEKAYPDILDLFLQVLDDGRLTDSLGRTVDFTNTIIIATSNAHSDIINDALGKGEPMADIAGYLKRRLTDVFKPELVNRFSKIVIFQDLDPADLEKVVILNLNELAEIVKAQGIYIDFDPAAVKQLMKIGYDPVFGARPLRRAVEEQVRAPLSEAILSKKIGKGDRVSLEFKDGGFSFVKE